MTMAMIKRFEISGYRGFQTSQVFEPAIPDQQRQGSGLTVVIGPNNAGKSALLEGIRGFFSPHLTFSEGKRNQAAHDHVQMRLTLTDGTAEWLKTIGAGGAATEASFERNRPSRRNILV